MNVPIELKTIATTLKNHGINLYIVGGYVRDSFLKLSSSLNNDIDICSNATPKELYDIFKNSEFKVKNINESVGVVAIIGNKRYEHATFRKEIYESDLHIPDKVEFIDSLEEDARRRDFRINAIYYDILKEEYIDPFGGISDLKNREITTVKVPKLVFDDDPERILRLIRFACSLGLNIPEEEMMYARQNAYKVAFLSKYRIRSEFEKILESDQIYPELLYTKDAHFRACVLIGELGLWKYILPSLYDIQQSKIEDKKGELLYEHILNCVRNASPAVRLAILLHDCAKFKTKTEGNTFFGSKEFVFNIVEKNLGINGLRYSKKVEKDITDMIIGYDFNSSCTKPLSSVKKFIYYNKDVVNEIIEIKNIVKNEGRYNFNNVRSAEILRKTYKKMKKLNTPFSLHDLKINGTTIIENFPYIKLENLDDLLKEILIKVVVNPRKNNEQDLLVITRKLINSKRDYYLEI